ncbi:hypothetical protein ACFL27_12570 [candidate division CSSED10-310 bacterium]|uniref:Uncharacterized protein n=1 Tax=candidate division CSSED10-310 bacterium TaxID=2855610 RepID=A0ABV6YXU8_UNCC1
MNKDYLIKTAREIVVADSKHSQEYSAHKDTMVAEVNRRMEQRSDIKNLLGEKNLEMMKDNHANHALFVVSILQSFNAEVLVETVLWVFRSYRSRNFHPNYWPASLRTWLDVLKNELSPESFMAIKPLYTWFIVNIPHFTALTESQLELDQDIT